mgnify:FL=1
MYKLSAAIVFIFLFFQNGASDQLCSVRKTENYCVCKRVTSQDESSVVTEADCSRIHLQSVPSQDQLTADLNLLDLSHNEIQELDENKNKLSSRTLQTLILSYNEISSISDKFFSEIPDLRKLILSHNKITTLDNRALFENCQKLTYLDLSFNHINTIQIDVFLPLVQLQFIDLSYNDNALGEWLTQNSDFLTHKLGLSLNISTIKLDNLNLTDLGNLYFVNYTNLKHLSLADNHFQEVPRVPYSVEYLDLSGSDISVLEVKQLSYHSLKTLRLDRMKKLENIHPYAFYNLEALEELSIRNCNNLKEFNELVFGAMFKNMVSKLKRLSLSGNALQHLNITYKYLFRTLDLVDLTDNPWTCDCDLLWLQEVDNLYKSDKIK